MSEELPGRETDARKRDHTQGRREHESDDREDALNEREIRLLVREVQVTARERTRADRLGDARVVRAQADERDEYADARDWNAGERDEAAKVESLLHRDDEDGKALAGRDAAHRDRRDAAADRTSAAVDRALLTEDDDPRDDGDATETADL